MKGFSSNCRVLALALFALVLVLLVSWNNIAQAADVIVITFTRTNTNLSGIQFVRPGVNQKVVGGLTDYKEGTAAPNRLWLFSNYDHEAGTTGVETAGEVVLATKDINGNVVYLRVFSSPVEGHYVKVNSDLVVDGDMVLDNTRVIVNQTGELELVLPNGTRRRIVTESIP